MDDVIWNLLLNNQDQVLQRLMESLFQVPSSFELVDPAVADRIIYGKFSGINPWILMDGKKVRLTEIEPSFAQEYESC